MEQEYHGKYLNIQGYKIHYLDFGKGDPILFIHGLGASMNVWFPILPFLKSKFRTIVIDFLGHGRSDKPLNIPFSLSFVVDFLHYIINELGIKRITMVGNSMGAFIALKYAFINSKYVNNLVLVDSAGFGKGLNFLMRLPTLPLLGKYISKPYKWNVRLIWEKMFYDKSLLSEEFINSEYERLRMPGASEFNSIAFKAGINISGQRWIFSKDELKKIEANTLIIWGKEDNIIPVSHAYIAHKYLINSKLHILDYCGHCPQMEKTDQFVKILFNFLSISQKNE